jgi:basic membrane protein A
MRTSRLPLLVLFVFCAVLVAFNSAARAQSEFKIGLVTDTGAVDDRSFNQSAWEGAQLAAEALDGVADYIETIDPADYANNIQLFAEQGYRVIVTVGFALGDATLAAANAYPDVHFIAVDVDMLALQEPQGVLLPNLTGLIFPEDQTGFLAGALAGRLTRSGIVGAVLPTDLPPVVRFKEGFEAGAKFTRPDVRVFAIYHPGSLTEAFDDPAWGAQTANQVIDQGADVIFSGGGKTGNGGLQAIAQRTTEDAPLYCIGVDTDQWLTVPEAQPCLVTSGLKLISEGVQAVVAQVAAGEALGGNFVGAVGLAPFHDFESVVPAEVQKELTTLQEELTSGKLKSDGTRVE